MEFILPSYAKVNWGLWLLGKRADGYHEIFTPIQRVSLADTIRIRPSSSIKIETSIGIPQNENFVYKGLLLFEELTGLKPNFKIYIDKKIPVGGGLGGGSSNLATVLRFVNDYFGRPLPQEKLIELLAKVSSDAPAFLCNGIALVTGRGERVRCISLEKFRGLNVTLFVPEGISSPTALIYSKTQSSMFVDKRLPKLLEEKLLESDPLEFFDVAENPLGDIFLELHPLVKEDIDFLQKVCYKKFIVSGSGSSFWTVGSLSKWCFENLDRLKGRYKIFSLVTL